MLKGVESNWDGVTTLALKRLVFGFPGKIVLLLPSPPKARVVFIFCALPLFLPYIALLQKSMNVYFVRRENASPLCHPSMPFQFCVWELLLTEKNKALPLTVK